MIDIYSLGEARSRYSNGMQYILSNFCVSSEFNLETVLQCIYTVFRNCFWTNMAFRMQCTQIRSILRDCYSFQKYSFRFSVFDNVR